MREFPKWACIRSGGRRWFSIVISSGRTAGAVMGRRERALKLMAVFPGSQRSLVGSPDPDASSKILKAIAAVLNMRIITGWH